MTRAGAYAGIAALLLLALGITLYLVKRMSTWTWPAKGRITSPFGNRTHPVTGAVSSFHNGIDIAVPEGTEVRAPMNGIVQSVYSNAAGGKQVILEHPNGWKTGFAHLSAQLVTPGQAVSKGDVIALSGNTGASTGPHLHFTMTNAIGEKVDPTKYLA